MYERQWLTKPTASEKISKNKKIWEPAALKCPLPRKKKNGSHKLTLTHCSLLIRNSLRGKNPTLLLMKYTNTSDEGHPTKRSEKIVLPHLLF